MAVDILGPLPKSSKCNQYILVAGDYFTKWMEAYAIPNQEAETVARVVTEEMFLRFSPPEQLHSDQGRQFESLLVAEICKLLGVKKTRTTPYHPQGDGMVERFNRTLISLLSAAIQDHHHDWEEHLRATCMAYNTSEHSTTRFTPFFLMFSREARMPIDIMFGRPPETEGTSCSQYASQLRDKLESAYNVVRYHQQQSFQRQKNYYDKQVHGNPYQEGDLVWLHSSVVPSGQSRKFHQPWTGPFKVVRQLSDCTYRIQGTTGQEKRIVVHFDRLKPYCPRKDPPSDTEITTTTPSHSPAATTEKIINNFGDHLQLVEDDSPEAAPVVREPRYPQRSRRPPERLLEVVEH